MYERYEAWERVDRVMKVIREIADTKEPTRTERFGTEGLSMAVAVLSEALETAKNVRED